MTDVISIEKTPVVSDDTKSETQVMMKEANRLLLQAKEDSRFDDIIERFTCQQVHTKRLLNLLVVGALLGLAIWGTKRRK